MRSLFQSIKIKVIMSQTNHTNKSHQTKNISEANKINKVYPHEAIIKPASNDVLLGRGAGTNNHLGNKYFRNIVKEHQDGYLVAKNNFEKYLTTVDILTNVKSLNPPGRFILQDKSTKLWNEVGDDKSKAQNKPSVERKHMWY